MTTRRADPEILETFTLYESPLDCPGYVVVRRRLIGVVRGEILLDPQYWGFRDVVDGMTAVERARAWISQEFPYADFCTPRDESDDPCVIETWM